MILDRYLGRNILVTSTLSLFVLVAVFSFFALVDQLDDTGRGSYGVPQAIQYVLLTIPRLSYELFPIATVIGSMAALGMLANTSELAVIRTSGVSQLQLAYSLMKTGIVFIVISILIGEVIAPITEQAAQQKRSVALTQQISMKTKHGFWSRDGDNYINIRKR
jgi:lipopolysaccharide export system permease protein